MHIATNVRINFCKWPYTDIAFSHAVHVTRDVIRNGLVCHLLWYQWSICHTNHKRHTNHKLSFDFTFIPPPPPMATEPVHSCDISTQGDALNWSYTSPSLSIYIRYRPTTHFHLSQVKHFRLKCLAEWHNIEKRPKIKREETWNFSENPSPSMVRNSTAGSDIEKAPRSNHCATSLSKLTNNVRPTNGTLLWKILHKPI